MSMSPINNGTNYAVRFQEMRSVTEPMPGQPSGSTPQRTDLASLPTYPTPTVIVGPIPAIPRQVLAEPGCGKRVKEVVKKIVKDPLCIPSSLGVLAGGVTAAACCACGNPPFAVALGGIVPPLVGITAGLHLSLGDYN